MVKEASENKNLGVIASTTTQTTKQLGRSQSVFGELFGIPNTPIQQVSFPYNLNALQVLSRVNGSGAVTQSNSKARLSSGTTTDSLAELISTRVARYRPGQGMECRFTALFTDGVANTMQVAGPGWAGEGLFFGYDGVDFGILRRHGGTIEIQTLTVTSGAVTIGGNITITLDGNDTIIAVTNGDSIQEVARKIGATDFLGNGTGWRTDVHGDKVDFLSIRAKAFAGAFTLSDVVDTTGTAGTFAEAVSGVVPTEVWVAQADFNMDKLDGMGETELTIDPSKGNVYSIAFQWLGFGEIDFSVEDPNTGRFLTVHKIVYANANTIPSLDNPTMPFFAAAFNDTTTSDIIVEIGSFGLFVQGVTPALGLRHSASATLSLATANETAILSIRVKDVYQGVRNRTGIELSILSIGVESGAKIPTFRVKLNSIIEGAPSFSDISVNTSVVELDTAGTTLSGGEEIISFNTDKTGQLLENLQELMIEASPGDVLTISMQIPSGTTAANVSLSWIELI